MAAPCATAKTIVCPPACLSCCSTILNGSLTEVYESHYNLVYTSMHLSFYPTAMPAQAAQALGVMEGRPALLLRRLNYDQHGRVLDLDIEYWRHDSLRIEVDTH